MRQLFSLLFAHAFAAAWSIAAAADAPLPYHVWLEAETFAPLRGSNFSITPLARQQTGAWAVAGPGVADAWTQGGECEWMSIAARAEEPAGVKASREFEVPHAGTYTLWVRYADYREREEAFAVRVTQGARRLTPGSFSSSVEVVFGTAPVIDELDPMKLVWDWAFGWARAEVPLKAGAASVHLVTTGPTGTRRQVDCLCFTTDPAYRPFGREKPDFAAWSLMRSFQRAGLPRVEPLLPASAPAGTPPAWKIADEPPAFLWNVGRAWADELKKPAAERLNEPFAVEEPLLKDFLAAHAGRAPRIYSEALSGPVWHIPEYPNAFASGAPALRWLEEHPARPFAVLLNYGKPTWPKDADRGAARANLQRFKGRFHGYIAGESIAHAAYDVPGLEAKVRAARNRSEVLQALRDVHTASVVQKFSDYYGSSVDAATAWAPIVSCLSANMEAFSHALCAWGVERIGHENTANSPTLARRLAFLRGAARQFGRKMVDYQSCNFGDSATMYSRQAYFYPASSRYVLDNSYDAFAGAGMNWLWKDYVLWHLAGVSAFFNEQGVDLFWKPGGGSAGDDQPVQLSPKGKVAEAALRLAREHPRGSQWTPIAFLMDEAHGWAQERFTPGAFGLAPELNPAVLTPGLHEASVRAWLDLAYFPAPETQNEPASAIRQSNVNALFGDIFDVIVNAPQRAEILPSYSAVIVAGEVRISAEWSRALSEYVEGGGTLVVCAGQLTGEGAAALALPSVGELRSATAFTWQPSGETVPAQAFRFHALPLGPDRVLATVEKTPMAVLAARGRGRIIMVGVPLGLAIDERPAPVLALLLRHLVQDITPVRAVGDVEWVLNRLEDGRWLVALLNNSGVEKPQHGIVPTRHQELRTVQVETSFAVARSEEWLAREKVQWKATPPGASAEVTVPAGAVRLLAIEPAK